jgi:hypothetical protein
MFVIEFSRKRKFSFQPYFLIAEEIDWHRGIQLFCQSSPLIFTFSSNFANDDHDFLSEYNAICETALARVSRTLSFLGIIPVLGP